MKTALVLLLACSLAAICLLIPDPVIPKKADANTDAPTLGVYSTGNYLNVHSASEPHHVYLTEKVFQFSPNAIQFKPVDGDQQPVIISMPYWITDTSVKIRKPTVQPYAYGKDH
jgi:hypothetical protein